MAVIFDLLVSALLWLIELVASMLPDHELDVSTGGAGAVVTNVAKIDSLVPIAGPVGAALVLLGFGVVFVGVRLVLMARHVLLP